MTSLSPSVSYLFVMCKLQYRRMGYCVGNLLQYTRHCARTSQIYLNNEVNERLQMQVKIHIFRSTYRYHTIIPLQRAPRVCITQVIEIFLNNLKTI